MKNLKIHELYTFLCANRKYNKAVQEVFYDNVISSKKTTDEKIISLLYHVANTQSKPNIDKLATFFKKIVLNRPALFTFGAFVDLLNDNKDNSNKSYSGIFYGLKKQDGWGNKTAALLVKSVYHLHNRKYQSSLKIWNDAPISLNNDQRFYLPVDAVIEFIFKELDLSINIGFDGINNYLSNYYIPEEIEIWDDLWFWGFITQKGSGESREMTWNENKYWASPQTSKDPNIIAEIKTKASEFMSIISS